ncbi:glycosyltransferase family 87 protein [Halorussus marinus]|uniref:glycosyltransferase family 87 protein n=1 Tax=Halorussus marinus TaxID=2505976 RepID=UPI00109237F3|nr:glycosyltransferase family 87 protein [Halorussus marinus]
MTDDAPPSPWPARIVLLAGVLLGIAGAEATLARRASLVGVDLKVYHLAAETALAGGDFYAASPAGHPYSYVYPPVTIPAFYPYALLDGWEAAFAVHTLVNVAAAVGVAALLVAFTERYRGTELPWVDRALVGAFAVASLHSVPSILYGETNFPLLLAIAAGFWWLEVDGEQTKAGVAFALPAVVKLFPAAVGLWLLRRRAWRAIAAATATGVGAFAVGVAAFGVDTHLTYVERALVPRLSNDQFVGGLDPAAQLVTVRRPLSVLFPSLPSSAYTALGFLALAPVVAYTFRRIETPIERLVAIFVTMAVMVVGFPSLLLYFAFLFFPLVPLLYLFEAGPERALFATGAFVSNVALTASNVETLVTETPIPDAAFEALAPALALATPPLYGTALMLAGCVLAVRKRAPTPTAPS